MPAIAKTYKRHAQRTMSATGNGWSTSNQGAECLYLILSTIKDGDKSALDFFTKDEIGDVDEDGFKEILDGWGTPILFLRWAPGYVTQVGPDGAWGRAGADDDGNGTNDDISEAGLGDDVGPQTNQTNNYLLAPDPFDPLKCDPRYSNTSAPQKPYALLPLICSAGRDKIFDVGIDNTSGTSLVYANTATGGTNVVNWTVPPNDPYFSVTPLVGTPADSNGDGASDGYADNITNHYQPTP